jgi:hypothetical protein
VLVELELEGNDGFERGGRGMPVGRMLGDTYVDGMWKVE